MLFTTLLICGTTSSARAQESDPLDPGNAEWVHGKNCWCIKSSDLAKAATALKFAKVKLELKDKEMQKRLELATQGCDMKLSMTKDFCQSQLDVVKSSCNAQIQYVLGQTESLVSNLTEAHAERLKLTTDLVKPQTVEWYRHPIFVGLTTGLVGVGVGILAGMLIERD